MYHYNNFKQAVGHLDHQVQLSSKIQFSHFTNRTCTEAFLFLHI